MKQFVHSIAVFLPNLEGGGAERVIVNLVNGFVEQGYVVDLVLVTAKGKYLHLLNRKVRLINLGTTRVARSLPRLVFYLRKNRPDILLTTISYASVIGLFAQILSGTDTRIFVRVETTLSKHLAAEKGFRWKLVALLVKALFSKADGIIAVSKGVAQDTIEFTGADPSRVHTIYNPACPDNIDSLADESIEEDWFDMGMPVVVAVGSLTEKKDYDTLVRAFEIVRRERATKLVVVGEGAERPSLEHLINELGLTSDVHLLGFAANPFKYMKRASVFVLSSKYEGLPGSLIQAMRCGCQVVSTDCEFGPSEILDQGRFGRLVPVSNATVLAEAILDTLLTNPDKQQQITRAKEFDSQRAIEAYTSLFNGSPRTIE